jgi:hypothetical protein
MSQAFSYELAYESPIWEPYESPKVTDFSYEMSHSVNSHYMRNHMRICEFIHSASSHEFWLMRNHMRVREFWNFLISWECLWVLITCEIIWGYANFFHSASSHEFWLMRNHLRIRDFDILVLHEKAFSLRVWKISESSVHIMKNYDHSFFGCAEIWSSVTQTFFFNNAKNMQKNL